MTKSHIMSVELYFVLILCLTCVCGCNDDLDNAQARQITSLIKKLGESPEKYIDREDINGCKEANVAYQKLILMGKEAIPYLVISSNSKALSNIVFQQPTEESTKVGDVCVEIINAIITDSLAVEVLSPQRVTKHNAREWLDSVKGLTLDEIKIEALGWYMVTDQADSFPAFKHRILPRLPKLLENYKDKVANQNKGEAKSQQ